MSFTISCPNCGMLLAVTESDIGKQGRCSRCAAVFTIQPPQPAATALAPAGIGTATAVGQDVTPGVIRVSEGISRCFTVLHSNLGVLILIVLCFVGISIGVGFLAIIPCIGVFINLASSFLIQPAMVCGFYRACLKQHDGATAEVGDLFAEFAQWVDILLLTLATVAISLVVCLPGIAVILLSMYPVIVAEMQQQANVPEPHWPILAAGVVLIILSAIVVGLGLMFVYPALVDRRRGVGDALKTSWQLMSSNPVGALGAVLMAGLLGILGFVTCCGWLYTWPAVQCMFASIYRTAMPPRNWLTPTPAYGAMPGWPPPAGPGSPLPPPGVPPAPPPPPPV